MFYRRTKKLLGEKNYERINETTVFIAGVGGVGSYVAEALTRAGVGSIILVDFDVIEESNINRQLHALYSTIGYSKVSVMKKRLLDINPNLKCHILQEKVNEDSLQKYSFNYLVDCIDDINSKILLMKWALKYQVPIISSMGTGNQIENRFYQISDISKTQGCPLAKVVRKKLREEKIYKGIKVCFTNRIPLIRTNNSPGSISYVPGTSGLLIAGEVIRDIIAATDV